ncbi:MAG TPA: hypothetical protein VGL61_03340 [Kofleriaceae bacterium]|jgi:hypothetical protein
MRKMLLLLVILGGCAQDARLPASYFAEGAHVLDPGQVSVTGAAGGGASVWGEAAGASGRVHVGIGDNQEIGVEASAEELRVPADRCFFGCDSSETNAMETLAAYSALASWKLGLTPNLALIAEGGVGKHDLVSGDAANDYFGHSVDGAFGLVFSRPISKETDVYLGGEVALAVPYGPRSTDATSVVGATAAVGLDHAFEHSLHGFVEGGGRLMFEGEDAWIPNLAIDGVAGIRIIL